MAGVVTNHAVSELVGLALDLLADQVVRHTRPTNRNRCIQRLLRDFHQLLGLVGDVATVECAAVVAVVAVQKAAYVNGNNIAVFEGTAEGARCVSELAATQRTAHVCRTCLSGMPWHTTSFTEVHTDLGKLPYPRGDG